MGFEVTRTVFVLQFEDPKWEGLEVKTRKPSMGKQFDMMKYRQLAQINTESLSGADTEKLRELFEFFAGFLDSWNLTDNGVPVPCTAESLLDQEDDFILAVLNAWMGAVSKVPDPLEPRSNGGGQLEVASIPTETLSASLVSLPEQS